MKAVVSSGLLFTYLFFNKLTSKPGSVNTVMGWSQLIIHRFIRILPPYLALVVLLEPLSFFLCRCHHFFTELISSVDVISRDSQFIKWHVQFSRVPFKLLPDKECMRIPYFSEKLFLIAVSRLK